MKRMIEIENDVANAANASFRFVKLLFETKPYTIKAINARKKIIPISDVCYFLLIYKNTTFFKYFSILFPLHIQQSKQLLIFTNIIHCLDK